MKRKRKLLKRSCFVSVSGKQLQPSNGPSEISLNRSLYTFSQESVFLQTREVFVSARRRVTQSLPLSRRATVTGMAQEWGWRWKGFCINKIKVKLQLFCNRILTSLVFKTLLHSVLEISLFVVQHGEKYLNGRLLHGGLGRGAKIVVGKRSRVVFIHHWVF